MQSFTSVGLPKTGQCEKYGKCSSFSVIGIISSIILLL